LKGSDDLPASSASRKRTVHRGAFPRTIAGFTRRTRSWVPGPLVGAEEEDRSVFVKSVLRSVPMVDVPIDNHYLTDPMFLLCIAGCDGHTVEDAKSHSLIRTRVMSGRPHRTESVVRIPLDHTIDRIQHASGSL